MNEFVSAARIAVAAFIGYGLTLAAHYVEITPEQHEAIVQVGATAVAYLLARLSERFFPKFRPLVFKKPGDVK